MTEKTCGAFENLFLPANGRNLQVTFGPCVLVDGHDGRHLSGLVRWQAREVHAAARKKQPRVKVEEVSEVP